MTWGEGSVRQDETMLDEAAAEAGRTTAQSLGQAVGQAIAAMVITATGAFFAQGGPTVLAVGTVLLFLGSIGWFGLRAFKSWRDCVTNRLLHENAALRAENEELRSRMRRIGAYDPTVQEMSAAVVLRRDRQMRCQLLAMARTALRGQRGEDARIAVVAVTARGRELIDGDDITLEDLEDPRLAAAEVEPSLADDVLVLAFPAPYKDHRLVVFGRRPFEKPDVSLCRHLARCCAQTLPPVGRRTWRAALGTR